MKHSNSLGFSKTEQKVQRTLITPQLHPRTLYLQAGLWPHWWGISNLDHFSSDVLCTLNLACHPAFRASYLMSGFWLADAEQCDPHWRTNWCHTPGSDGKESARNVGDPGLIPRSRRSPGEGDGNPVQYSCLENFTDGGAWRATVHGVVWVTNTLLW